MRRVLVGTVALVLPMALAVACGLGLEGTAGMQVGDGGTADGQASALDASGTDDAWADGGATDASDAAVDACPGGGGPSMVRVPAGFCIDATEVTNAQYAPFYAAALAGDAGAVPPSCTWNTDYLPSTWNLSSPYFAAAEANVPVHAVDWCDAWMFCRFVGKRLCGTLGGAPTPSSEAPDAQANAWTYACSAGGTRAYPYGSGYDASACNGDAPLGDVVDAGAFAGCAGGFPGILDMSGNAWEWDDSCADGGASATCHVRGGSVVRGPAELTCATSASTPRDDATGNNGIRCCLY